MDTKTILILIGVGLQFAGGISYLIDTVKGRVRPNKVSWLLWSLAPLIAFYAEIKQGVGIQALATFIVGFTPFVVFIASFVNKGANWKISTLDIVCGTLSIVGLILWYITKVGNVAIIFSIFADLLASIPTVIKSYQDPESEVVSVYLLGLPNTLFAIFLSPAWNIEHIAFPLYILIVNSTITVLVWFKLGPKITAAFQRKPETL